jgi:NADH dehydrogenase FAD-containing subunit
VIIGGGFGGLNAARGLAGAPVSVTLIDKRNYHLFRPMLYQVATGLLSADQISGPLRSILSRQANVEVLMDEVTGIDAEKRLVSLMQHSISYDYLVLATGIQYNYFGHDEWRRVAPGLESLDDADLIRGKILLAFERAEEMAALDHADTEGIRQLLTFVLVGAGTVGVEMASTLAEMSRMALAHDFRHIDPRDAQILLYDAAAHVVAPSRNLFGIKSKKAMVMPGVAQPAIQEGRYVAALIRRRVAGQPPPAPFWYWDKGDLAIAGRTYALADLRMLRFTGFPAWVVWAVVHIYFLIGFANRFFVMLQWLLAFLTKRRQVRVFPGQERRASL